MNEEHFSVETVFQVADPDHRRQCWEGYEEAHQDSAELCIQEQRCYDERTFEEALLDQEYIKHLLLHKGRAVGLIGGTNNLEKARVAYVNPAVLRQRHPEEVEAKTLWYMPMLFVRKDYQRQGATRLLWAAHAEYFVDRRWMIASDYATGKHAWFNLDYFVEAYRRAFEARGRVWMPIAKVLGGQEYFSIEFK